MVESPLFCWGDWCNNFSELFTTGLLTISKTTLGACFDNLK